MYRGHFTGATSFTAKEAGAYDVLPEVEAAATAIKSKDVSVMDIPEESFAS